jgi:hypothetical protein
MLQLPTGNTLLLLREEGAEAVVFSVEDDLLLLSGRVLLLLLEALLVLLLELLLPRSNLLLYLRVEVAAEREEAGDVRRGLMCFTYASRLK